MKATVILSATILLGSINASDGESNHQRLNPFIDLGTYPTPQAEPKLNCRKIESAKLARIRDGMTLGALVQLLGQGYIGPNEGVGIGRWFFKDGRLLCVFPHEYTKDETLHFSKAQQPGDMWIVANPPSSPSPTPAELKRSELVPLQTSN